uniref:GPI ethanolamine phosphate transferase 1 n=1 Tax=Angiostrongylus cantonensis TaxID=6313 RepID=A0A0K0CYW9_ANGCA
MEWRFALAGVLIHAVLIYSIFDIYYTSPVISNVPAHEITNQNPPAKRLVVISADGLRLDTFFQHSERSPFLHSLIRERKGVHGTSRSHVPTESRPGHVAIFAGFTEDVSAVARGWKYNPVQFDSIFNRSGAAWLWGSPDIVSLFDNSPVVHLFMYSANDEDFGSKEAYKLDEWVFEQVEIFFKKAKNDPTLMSSLFSNRRVFFLHLLGLDTNGHGNKPHSQEYLHNIEVVDRGIQRMQQVFDSFFDDQSTAWVFTSDHGMTDWGSHGAGSDEEVRTPFVAWGAGIRKGGSSVTINQIDLTPFFASLIGSPIPVNSLGILPLQLFDVSPHYLFKSSFSNFLQLKEQFMVLRAQKAKRLWFKDFDQFGLHALESLEEELVKLGRLRRFSVASSLFVQNAPYIKMAIFYYHRYDRSFLGVGVSLCFMSWIWLVDVYKPMFTKSTVVPNQVFIGIIACMLVFCLYCQLPLTNWIYLLLPIFLFSSISNILDLKTNVSQFAHQCLANHSSEPLAFLLKALLGLIGLCVCLFLNVIIFVDRRFLALLFIALTVVPNIIFPLSFRAKSWRTLCLILLPFPFFPNVGKFELPWLCVSAPIIFGTLLWHLSQHPLLKQKWDDFLHIFGVFGVPPAFLRFISWCSLPLSLILPLFSPPMVVDRTIWYISSLFVPYSLLSIAYESFFILCLIPLLLMFLRFEFHEMSDTEFLYCHQFLVGTLRSGRVSATELRIAALCMSFVLASLFGTGNFASMNSFNPSSLNKFISVFSPLTMTTLLLFKLFIPLLMVSLLLTAVLRFNRKAIQRLSCIVLILTDLMAMCFFHQLKDEGSWLDIGLSISHYLISMCMSVVLLLLLMCSSSLMTTSLSRSDFQHFIDVIKTKSSQSFL